MDFSDVLGMFEIKEILFVENYILGQTGYLFRFPKTIAYLYEETKGANFAELIINSEKIELSKIELDKIHSLIRLERLKPKKLQQKDFWIYSRQIENTIGELLELRPELVKGSTHMAFKPKNYTRFSENLIFDFNYLYDDYEICNVIKNFDSIFENMVKPKIDTPLYKIKTWQDGNLYRYLIDYIKVNRISVNGKLSIPVFLRRLFHYSISVENKNNVFNFGPFLLFLSTNHGVRQLMPRKQSIDFEELSKTYEIIYPDYDFMIRLYKDKFELD